MLLRWSNEICEKKIAALYEAHTHGRLVAGSTLAAKSHSTPELREEESLPWPDRRWVVEADEIEGISDDQ